MGDIFILIYKKFTILIRILFIVHCLFHPDFGEFDYMYMVVILLLISWIAWLIGKVLNLLISNKERKEKNTKIMDSHSRLRSIQSSRSHNNSEDGAEHQSDDQINRLCPVLFQCPADQLYYTENAD